MFSKLRVILLTQYIGSILVALLGWQAMVEIISTVVRSAFWYFNERHSQFVLSGSPGAPYRWDSLIFSAVTVVLYLLTAYALARWLYPSASPPTLTEAAEEQSPDQSEPA